MVGAEGLRCEEDVVEVGFDEPVAECAPESARCQRRDEAQFGIGARRCFDGDEFVDGADVGLSFGVAAYYVFLPFTSSIVSSSRKRPASHSKKRLKCPLKVEILP